MIRAIFFGWPIIIHGFEPVARDDGRPALSISYEIDVENDDCPDMSHMSAARVMELKHRIGEVLQELFLQELSELSGTSIKGTVINDEPSDQLTG